MGLFGGEQIDGALVRLPVDAHVRDGIEPDSGRGVDRTEPGELKPVEEIFFDVSHAVFHPAFLVAFAYVAGNDVESPVVRGIEVAWIDYRRLANQPLQHRGLQIVYHDLARATMEGRERVLMAGEEVLHRLRDGKFQMHQPAVTQHHPE